MPDAPIAGDVKVARTRSPIRALKMLGISIGSIAIAFVVWKLGGVMGVVEGDSLVAGVRHFGGPTTLAFYGLALVMAGLGVLAFFLGFAVVIVGVRSSSCPNCRAELDVSAMPATVRCDACQNEYRVLAEDA